MRKALSTILIALLAVVAFAQPKEAEYGYVKKSITRLADGSTDYNVSFSLTLFTHTAMNSTYGQTYVIYNPRYQQVKINKAYTIRKDGKRIDLPERALSDVLPSWAAGAADFNDLKEKVIVHTGLDLGSTIYLDYTIHSAPGFNKFFDFRERIDETSPIKEFVLTVSAPLKDSLRCKLYSPTGKPVLADVVEGSGVRRVNYMLSDIPARSRDEFQVNDLTRHYNFFCTISDFETELKDMFYGELDPDIRRWAGQVVSSEPDASKRYRQIRNYVANEFTVVNIPLGVANGLRPMAQIRRGAYITPYEQAALLNQMLRACNIKSDVRVSFDQTLPAEFRTLNNVQQFYVTQQIGEEEKTLVPSANSGEVTPAMAVGLGYERIRTDQGMQVEKTYNLEVKTSDFRDGCHVFTLPANNAGVAGWGMAVLPTLRETDFELPAIIDETETYMVKVPQGTTLRNTISLSMCDPATGAAISEQATVGDDGVIKVLRHISLPKKIYTPEEYGVVRKIIMKWLDSNRRKLMLTNN